MHTLQSLKHEFNHFLVQTVLLEEPLSLYEPFRYIMNLGGKRIRPICCVAAYIMFEPKKNYSNVLPAALAIEIFHNFTLVHDDIMDESNLRRGKATVHKKYGLNTAILSGDVMLIKAYQVLCQTQSSQMPQLLQIFNKVGQEVCEGQQYDMDFEQTANVNVASYLKMIGLKTASLLATSLKMGAIVAHANEEDAQRLYEFGRNIGIAFQLQDDILDTYGKGDKIGKKVGGDILQNKRTYLLTKALEIAKGSDLGTLHYWLHATDYNQNDKIEAVKAVFDKLKVRESAKEAMQQFYEQAFVHLASIKIEKSRKKLLLELVDLLMKREQ
ncbi:MAG: polyprenyl synthetase family protein [Chitinophagales bacterium]